MEQELPTHPSGAREFTPVFSGVRVARSLVFYAVFCISFFLSPFVLILFTIVLSLLQFTASNYPFGIFKFF